MSVGAMADRNPQPLFHLTLRPLPDRTPATVRLRRLLKILLRAYGFRVLGLRQVVPDGPAAEDEDGWE
jgi:hypothetical protein